MNSLEYVRHYDNLAKEANIKRRSDRSSFSRYAHYTKKEWSLSNLSHRYFLELNDDDKEMLKIESLTEAICGCFGLILKSNVTYLELEKIE